MNKVYLTKDSVRLQSPGLPSLMRKFRSKTIQQRQGANFENSVDQQLQLSARNQIPRHYEAMMKIRENSEIQIQLKNQKGHERQLEKKQRSISMNQNAILEKLISQKTTNESEQDLFQFQQEQERFDLNQLQNDLEGGSGEKQIKKIRKFLSQRSISLQQRKNSNNLDKMTEYLDRLLQKQKEYDDEEQKIGEKIDKYYKKKEVKKNEKFHPKQDEFFWQEWEKGYEICDHLIEQKDNQKQRLKERINIFHKKKYEKDSNNLPVVAKLAMNSTFREYSQMRSLTRQNSNNIQTQRENQNNNTNLQKQSNTFNFTGISNPISLNQKSTAYYKIFPSKSRIQSLQNSLNFNSVMLSQLTKNRDEIILQKATHRDEF